MWLYHYSDAMNSSLKKTATILVDIVWLVSRCMGCLVLSLGVPNVWTVGFIIAYTAFYRHFSEFFKPPPKPAMCQVQHTPAASCSFASSDIWSTHQRQKKSPGLCGLNMSIQGENVNRYLLFRRVDVHPWWRLAQEGLESRHGCHILPLYVDILSDCFILSAVLSPKPIYSNKRHNLNKNSSNI